MLKGDTLQAIKFCSVALDLNPEEHDAYKLRGYAYLTDHHFERANADFRAALKLEPNDHEDRAGLAQSLSGQGLFAEAVANYRVAVALAPHKAPYWSALCWARAGTGRQLKQALAECNRALALQPGAAAALNGRGLVRLRMNQYPGAIKDYDASLAAGPRQASARFGRGLAHLLAGQKQQGAADIVQARRIDPGIDGLFRLLGVLSPDCADAKISPSCPSGFPQPVLQPFSRGSMVAATVPDSR
jgi:tetratricopeptide (TPR) repeat protein